MNTISKNLENKIRKQKQRKTENKIKITDLKLGQLLKEGNNICEVVSITLSSYSLNKFEVQYISGVCITYKENDTHLFETYIG